MQVDQLRHQVMLLRKERHKLENTINQKEYEYNELINKVELALILQRLENLVGPRSSKNHAAGGKGK